MYQRNILRITIYTELQLCKFKYVNTQYFSFSELFVHEILRVPGFPVELFLETYTC